MAHVFRPQSKQGLRKIRFDRRPTSVFAHKEIVTWWNYRLKQEHRVWCNENPSRYMSENSWIHLLSSNGAKRIISSEQSCPSCGKQHALDQAWRLLTIYELASRIKAVRIFKNIRWTPTRDSFHDSVNLRPTLVLDWNLGWSYCNHCTLEGGRGLHVRFALGAHELLSPYICLARRVESCTGLEIHGDPGYIVVNMMSPRIVRRRIHLPPLMTF